MGNREQKQFHFENRTHVTKREYSGAEISIDNSANAPMDLRIFANSFQKVTKKGKNLYNHDKAVWSASSGAEKTENGVKLPVQPDAASISWASQGITYDKTYTLSYSSVNSSGGLNSRMVIRFIDKDGNNVSSSHASKVCNSQGKNGTYNIYYNGVFIDSNIERKDVTIKYNESADIASFKIALVGVGIVGGYINYTDIQLEEGTFLTEYEAFIPDSPSKDYPSDIYPLSQVILKSSNEKEDNSTKIPFVGYAMEVSDFEKSNFVFGGKYYLCDYIEYDSKINKAFRYKYIDDKLLDNTLILKDQLQAILKEPLIEELIPFNDEYMFSDVKSIQGGCKISTKSYSEDELSKVNPLCLGAKVNVIK